ncbi:tandem-95 repeat protein, partial [Bacteroidales bacterium OttesenSCG-928-K03]|nr:tandem-95 repeat protein [Odoribacter sp. OttesenSCG-928-L07]MDL2242682.1 tandem-95 repeat protein [Bacteroidales bacterium OttesenSCG-928-K03]
MIHFYELFKEKRVAIFALIVAIFFVIAPNLVNAQVRKDFEPRKSTQGSAQERTIYNVRGDFSLIGNTSMTLNSFSISTYNGGSNTSMPSGNQNTMIYVDVDGDPTTLNSSSATLSFSGENGATDECTNIVYAGLYWSGRAQNTTTATSSNPIPQVTKRIQGTITNGNGDGEVIKNGNTIPSSGGNNTMTVTRESNGQIIRYAFQTSSGTTYIEFKDVEATHTDRNASNTTGPYVRYGTSTDNINTYVPTYSVVEADGNRTVTFRPIQIRDAGGTGVIVTVDQLTRVMGTTTGQDGQRAVASARVKVGNAVSVSKTYNKREIKIKHESDAAYRTFTANEDDILYPGATATGSANMYAAYVDVTDFVRNANRGTGVYTVADMALTEGAADGTGYYGSWGMVVVYENSVMPWRDIVVFDGYAYTQGGNYDYSINIDGIHAVQEGNVKVKLGLMAGEGDYAISGDYFQVCRQVGGEPPVTPAANDWRYINRSGNVYTPGTNNFFNSMVQTSDSRYPNIEYNNTGIDIALFELQNTGTTYDKYFVTNNQTSMKLRYGSTGDTYIIYSFVAAIDAYIPEPEALNLISEVNGEQISWTYDPETGLDQPDVELLPGDTIKYTLEIRNKGKEAIDKLNIVMPVPYTAILIEESVVAQYNWTRALLDGYSIKYPGVTIPDHNNSKIVFNSQIGSGGQVEWYVGDYVYQSPHHVELSCPGDDLTDPDCIQIEVYDLLARLTFEVVVTDDCYILAGAQECVPAVTIFGESSGWGHETGVSFAKWPFVYGFKRYPCEEEPITVPPVLRINAPEECNEENLFEIRTISLCGETPTSTEYSTVSSYFMAGVRFFSHIDEETGKAPEGCTVYDPGRPLASQGCVEFTSTSDFPAPNSFYPDEPSNRRPYYAIPTDPNNICYWTFYLVDLPIPEISIDANQLTICQGESVDLQALVTLYEASEEADPVEYPDGYTYTVRLYEFINEQWTQISPPVVTPDVTTTYRVQAQIDRSMCFTDMNDIVITVLPKANVEDPFTEDICTGSSFSIDPQDILGEDVIPEGTTFSWAAPDSVGVTGLAAGDGATVISGTLTSNRITPVSIVYTVTPTTVTGTEDPCEGDPFNVVITVYPILPAPSTNNLSVCLNGTINLINAVADGTYNFYISETDPTPIDSEFTNVTSDMAGTYWVALVSDETGLLCDSERASFTLTVSPLPTINITTTISEVQCSGGIVTLTATSDIGTTINWYDSPDGTTSIGSGTPVNIILPTVTTQTTFTYYVEAMVGTDGCVSATRASIDITVNPYATVDLITSVSGTTRICEDGELDFGQGGTRQGGTTTLTAAASGVTTPIYKWYTSQTAEEPIHTGAVYTPTGLTETITYYISVSGTNYCENPVNERREITVTVQKMPVLNILVDNDSKCYTESFALSAEIENLETISGGWFGWYLTDEDDPNGYEVDPIGAFSPMQVNATVNSIDEIYANYKRANATENNISIHLRVNTVICGYIIDNLPLEILPYPTSAELTWVSQPEGYQEVCDPVFYEVKIESTGEGNIQDMEVTFEDTNNTLITVSDAYYFILDTNGEIVGEGIQMEESYRDDPDVSSTTSWKFPDIESNEFILEPDQSVMVRIEVMGDCGFYSGDYYTVVLDAIGTCDVLKINERLISKPFLTETALGANITYVIENELDPLINTNETGNSGTWTATYTIAATSVSLDKEVGTYDISVKDAKGETFDFGLVSIEEITGCCNHSVIINTSDATCSNHDGSITILVNGGSDSYLYSFTENGVYAALPSDGVIRNLAAGTYFIYVRDNTCTLSEVATISTSGSNLELNIDVTNATNYEINDGAITVGITGGTPDYRFSLDGAQSWLPILDGAVISNLTPGTHFINIIDANDCIVGSGKIVIGVTDILSVQATSTPSGTDAPTGSINLDVISGTGPYTYYIDGLVASNANINLAIGLHTWKVTDAGGCSSEGKIFVGIDILGNYGEVGEDIEQYYILANITDASCSTGLNEGNITISVTGGDAPFEYSLDGGDNYDIFFDDEYVTSGIEYMVFLLPPNYEQGEFRLNGVEYEVSDDEIIVDSQGSEYSILIPTELRVGDSFGWELDFDVTNVSCGVYGSYNQVFYEIVASCEGVPCEINEPLGSVYVQFEVEGYIIDLDYEYLTDNDELSPTYGQLQSYANPIADTTWTGYFDFTNLTDFIAEGEFTIEYYIDENNNDTLDSEDGEAIYTHLYTTEELDENDGFRITLPDEASLRIEKGKQFLMRIFNNELLCEEYVMPIPTLYGPNKVCRSYIEEVKDENGNITETIIHGNPVTYYSVPDKSGYLYTSKSIDGVTGATPKYLVDEGDEIPEEIILVFPEVGPVEFTWTYTATSSFGERTLVPVSIRIEVVETPLLDFVSGDSERLCLGNIIELSEFIKDANEVEGTVFSFYKPVLNEETQQYDYTLVGTTKDGPVYDNPEVTTTYLVTGQVGEEGCEAFNSLEFTVIVDEMPEIWSIGVLEYPDCGEDNGSIWLGVFARNENEANSYEYSINNANGPFTPFTLDDNGVLEITGLTPGHYTIYVHNKVALACDPSQSLSISLVPINTDLTAEAIIINNIESCGDEDGQIQLIANGGKAPYYYKVEGRLNSEYNVLPDNGILPINFAQGRYYIWVKDSDECEYPLEEVLISAENDLQLTITKETHVDCEELGAMATITIDNYHVTNEPYRYRLNSQGWKEFIRGQESITILSYVGLNTIIVIDNNNCGVSKTFEIEHEKPSFAYVSVEKIDATCENESGGQIIMKLEFLDDNLNTLYYTFGDGEYKEIERQAGTNFVTVTIPNLPVGTYELEVSDDNGCYINYPGITIGLEKGTNINIGSISVVTQPNCTDETGSIHITVYGGEGRYGYNLDGGTDYEPLSADGIIGDLAAGVYTVYVQDLDNLTCSPAESEPIRLTPKNTNLSVTVLEINPTVYCGDATGSLRVLVDGGIAPYIYELDGVETTVGTDGMITELANGEHELKVTDAEGCFVYASGIVISSTYGFSASIANVSPATCVSDGQVRLTIAVPPSTDPNPYYSYRVSGYDYVTFAGMETLIDLPAGNYSITVFDANGCMRTGSFVIPFRDGNIAISNIIKTDAKCDGTAGGTITFSVTGSSSSFSYRIDEGDYIDITASPVTIDNLAEGTYTLHVLGNDGCEATHTNIKIGMSNEPNINVTSISIAAQPLCGTTTGAVRITAVGASTYEYQINGQGAFLPLADNGVISDLAAGTYYFIVREAGNLACPPVKTDYITIEDNTDLAISLETGPATTCGIGDGQIHLSVGGGTSPYRYTLKGIIDSRFDVVTPALVPAHGNLGITYTPGDYVVNVTDANGCTASALATVEAEIGIELTLTTTQYAYCDGRPGTFRINVSGGTEQYSYILNYGNAIPLIGTVLTVEAPAGYHFVEVIDANNCYASDYVYVNTQSEEGVDLISTIDAPCDGTSGGSAIFRVGTTSSPRPTSYTIAGVNYTAAATGDFIVTGLAQGTYSITFYYESGCNFTINDIQIGRDPSSDLKIESIYVVEQPACLSEIRGAIRLIVSGGSGSYEWAYSTSLSNKYELGDGIIDGLSLGVYTIYVWDALNPNCTPVVSNPIELSPRGNDFMLFVTGSTVSGCDVEEGSISANVVGYKGNLTYSIDDATANPFPEDGNLGLYKSGTYLVTVFDDELNCAVSAQATVNVNPTSIGLSLSQVQPAYCMYNGIMNITISPSAGDNSVWRYQLDGKDWRAFVTNSVIEDVTAGWHKVIVSNNNGCITDAEIYIDNTADIILSSVTTKDASCDGTTGGSIQLNIAGGTAPYSIIGKDLINKTGVEAGDVNITDLPVGVYSLSVIDAMGCIATYEKITINRAIEMINANNDFNVIYKNTQATGNIFDNDFDYNNNLLTLVRFETPTKGGSINIDEFGNYTYLPVEDFIGIDTIAYTVINTCGLESQALLIITVLDDIIIEDPLPPVAITDFYSTYVNQEIEIMDVRVNDTERNGGTLSDPYIISQPSNGTLTDNGDGTFSYEPNFNFVGTDVFYYKVCSNEYEDLCDSTWVTIVVTSNEDIIYAFPDWYTVPQNEVLIANSVLGNDLYNGFTPVVTLLSQPSNGAISLNADGTFEYLPDVTFYGTDAFMYKLCATDTDVACDTAWVYIYVNQIPCPVVAPPSVQSPQIFCPPATVADLVASGQNIKWYLAPTGGEALASDYPLEDGGTYYASQSVGICESDQRSYVLVFLREQELDPPAILAHTFCVGETLGLYTQLYSNIVWYESASATEPITDHNILLTDGATYYAARVAGACESALRTEVEFTEASEFISHPIANQSFCDAASISDIKLTVPGNVTWYPTETSTLVLTPDTRLVTGTYWAAYGTGDCQLTERIPVVITIDEYDAPLIEDVQDVCPLSTIANIVVEGAGITWYAEFTLETELSVNTPIVDGETYYAVQSNGYCKGEITAVTVNELIVNPPSVKTPQEFCEEATVADLYALGVNLKWYNAAGELLSPTTALYHDSIYFVTQNNGLCESEASYVKVIIVEELELDAPIILPLFQRFCSVEGMTVADLWTNGLNVVWYSSETGGDPLDSTTPLAAGSVYYAASVAGECESALRTEIGVLQATPQTPPAIEDQQFCDGALVGNLVTPNDHIVWYSSLEGGEPLSPSTVLVQGYYYAAQRAYDGCESSTRRSVYITIDEPEVVITPATQIFCVSAKIADLEVAGAGVKWFATVDATTALVLDFELTNGSTYYSAQTNGDCEGERTAVTVTIYDLAALTADSPQSFCPESTIANIVISDIGTGNDINWYDAAGNVLTETDVLVHEATYYVSQSNDYCESEQTPILIDILPTATPVQIVTTDATICTGSSTTLTAGIATGVEVPVTYLWYDADDNPLTSRGDYGEIFDTPVLTDTTSYFVAITAVNFCENLPEERKEVVVNVNEMPTMELTSSHSSVCPGGTFGLSPIIENITQVQRYQWQYKNASGVFVDGNGHFFPYSSGGSAAEPVSINALTVTYRPQSAHVTNNTVTVRLIINTGVCGEIYKDIELGYGALPVDDALIFVSQPESPITPCEEQVYELRAYALEEGNLSNISLALDDRIATGINAVRAEFEYYDNISNTTIGPIVMDRDSVFQYFTFTMPEDFHFPTEDDDFLLSAGDSIDFKVYVNATCGFFSDGAFDFILNASDACGEAGNAVSPKTITANPFILDFHESSPATYSLISYLNVTKAVDWTSENHDPNNNLNPTNNDNRIYYADNEMNSPIITWTATYKFEYDYPDYDHDSIYFLIPPGMEYIEGSFECTTHPGLYVGLEPTISLNNDAGLEYMVGFPETGIDIGEEVTFTFQFSVEEAACDSYDFYMEIIHSGELECDEIICKFYRTEVPSYFGMKVQWYEMEFLGASDKSYGVMLDDEWTGQYEVKNISAFYTGDDLFIDFYIDLNNNGILDIDEKIESNRVAQQHFTTVGNIAGATFELDPEISVPAQEGYQLLAVHYGGSCYDMVVPISTLFGADTLCVGDIEVFTVPAGMDMYTYSMSIVSGSSTAPTRLPLEGNSSVTENDSQARFRFDNSGKYNLTAFYVLNGTDIMRVSREIVVNPRPVLVYQPIAQDGEITVCAGDGVDLLQYITYQSHIDYTTFTFYEVDGEDLNLVGSGYVGEIVTVIPTENTLYRAFAAIDDTGCEALLPLDLQVNVLPSIEINALNIVSQPSCSDNTGSIFVSVVGGSGSYSWSFNENGPFTNTLAANGIIEDLAAGSYTVYVVDNSGDYCGPAYAGPISLNPYNSDIVVTAATTPSSSCYDETSSSSISDGTIILSIGGGVAPYEYMLVGIDADFSALPANYTIGSLDADTYSVLVKDYDGCVASTTAVVGANAGMSVAYTVKQEATCDEDGMVHITVTGGNGVYSYQLNNGPKISMVGDTTDIIVGIGTHNITVFDSGYCTDELTITIDAPGEKFAEVVDFTNALCDGTASGSVTITFDDLDRPVQYYIGSNTPSDVPATGDLTIEGLSEGTYSVSFIFADDCVLTLNNIVIGRDPNAVIEVRSVYVNTFPTCDDADASGSIVVEVIGGSGSYEYNFDNGDTKYPLAPNGLIEDLTIGAYIMHIWDTNTSNCAPAINTSFTLRSESSDLKAIASATPATDCSADNGEIFLQVTGGVGVVEYTINGTDYFPIPAHPYSIGNGFATDTYTITVVDEIGCYDVVDITVETAGSDLNFDIDITNATCASLGQAIITIDPPAITGTWRYTINGGPLLPFLNNEAQASLAAGNHTIEIENTYGCIYSEEFTIGSTSGMSVTAAPALATCEGIGEIVLDITGGTAPYFAHFAAGDNFGFIIQSPGKFTAPNLPVGRYYIMVTDADGCIFSISNVEIITETNYLIAVNDYNITYVNKPVSANVLDNDIDFLLSNAVLTVIENTTPNNGSITIAANGYYTYTPNAGFVGCDTVMYTVQHDCGYIQHAYLYLRVIYEYISPRPPVAVPDLYTTDVNVSIDDMSVMDNDTDIDGGVISISSVLVQPVHGTLTDNGDGTFDYTPGTDFVGTDYFSYKICNEIGLCDSTWVTIIVSPLEDEPEQIIAFPDFYSMTQDGELEITVINNGVLPNDIYPNSAPLITILTQPTNGYITNINNNGTFTYVPNSGFYGNDLFQYQLCVYDGTYTCSTAWVSILVLANDCPNIMPPVVTTPQEFCSPATVADLIAEGLNIKWYENETAIEDEEALELTETLVDGKIYYASQTDEAGCESERRSPVKVSVVQSLTLLTPEIDSPQSFCAEATISDIITTYPNLVWYDAATNGNVLAPETELADGVTYYAGFIAGDCESAYRAPVRINIVGEVTIVPVIADQSFCLGAMISDIVVGDYGNIVWFLDPDNSYPLSPDTKLTQRTYYAGYSVGDCEITHRVPVAITLLENEAPIAEQTQYFCYGSTLADLEITGAGVKWYDAATNGNELPLSTMLEDGNIYYAVQSNGSCEGEVLAVTTEEIIVLPPIVTSPQNFCEPAYVSDLKPNGQDIIWYSVDTGGTPLDSDTELVDGNTYWAAKTNGVCESVFRSPVVAIVKDFIELQAPVIESPQQVCNFINPILNSTLADIITDGSNLAWYSSVDDDTPLPINTTLINGNTYYAALVAGDCESTERTPVVINVVDEITLIPIIEDQSFCEGATLADIAVPNNDIIWYYFEGNSTMIEDWNTPLENRTYWASQLVGYCESSVRVPVQITVGIPSAPIADPEQFFCEDVNPTVGNIKVTGSGIKWFDAPENGDEVGLDTPLTHGVTYYAAQTNDECIGETTPVTVWLYYNVNPPVVSSPQEFCVVTIPTTLTLAAVQVQGINVRWYDAEVGGNELPLTTVLTNEMVYWASQSLGHCESERRTAVKVILTEEMIVPAPVITSPQQFCAGGTVADLLTNGYGEINWYFNETHTIPLDPHTPLVPGATYYAGLVLGDCESTTRTPVTVTLVPEITIIPAIADQSFCEGAILASVIVPNSSIVWYLSPTGGDPLSELTVLETRTYYAAQAVGECENTTRVAVNITITTPSAPIIPDEQMFCAGATIGDLEVIGHGVHWYATIDDDAPLALTIPLEHNTTYYAANSASDICEGARAAVLVKIYDNVPPPTVESPVELCEVAGNLTLANISVQGVNIKWYASETSTEPLPLSTPLVNGTTYWVSQSIGNCESGRSYVYVKIDPEMEIPAPVIDPIELCETLMGTVRIMDLPVNGQTVVWYLDAAGSFVMPPATHLTSNITLFASQVIGECQSTTLTTVPITFSSEIITIPVIEDQVFCEGAMISSIVVNDDVNWYATLDGTEVLAPEHILETATYYAAITVGDDCESTQRVAVEIVIDPTDYDYLVATQSFCYEATVKEITVMGYGITWYLEPELETALDINDELTHGATYYGANTNGTCALIGYAV